ncbi:histidine phosphatase family protein [Paenibacillus sp. J2TS4]|uniref:histidine phosphatase family protein n=1 Tax=Paenibacillus sp. J2TS4 TaxID=2807194 RepID=UPI001B00FF1E|nr:histidine phosphatase family protein [Paenibacillus sp. J2TS4]GIP31057.1 putative phosphatase PhoE [Paenibacillus sp. J2TS4]
MTTIGLVRHGVTDWNREGRAQGQRDIPLNEEGLQQARLIGNRLAQENWDYIYTSDLIRARRTAELIASAIGIPLTGTDPRLREKSHGRLDGTIEQERIELWGSQWRELDHGEESIGEVRERSLSFLKEIIRKHPRDKVLIVSHGAWIRATIGGLVKDREITPLHNTSICVLQHTEEHWNCLLYNCTRHLAPST